MKKLLFILFAIFTAGALSAERGSHQMMKDKNADEKISEAEWLAHFDEVDANKDSSITLKEMEEFHKKIAEKNKAEEDGEYRHHKKHPDPEKMKKMTENHFKEKDLNQDGKISREECLSIFKERDLNGDGEITKKEMKKFYKQQCKEKRKEKSSDDDDSEIREK